MITINTIPDEYKSDHLFLLIGTNPLPNFVAARLLANAKAHVHLLHTDVTGDFAQRLQRALTRHLPAATFALYEIPSADNVQIRKQVSKIIEELRRSTPADQSYGLHYTGGTAAMSVHTYSVLEQLAPDAVFSYLDARTLSLRFDGHKGEQARLFSAGKDCKVDLDELVQLHGYSGFKKDLDNSNANEFMRKVIRSLIAIHKTEEGYDKWREYGRNGYSALPGPKEYPALKPFTDAVAQFCSELATPQEVAQALGRFAQLTSYSKWFNGE